MMNFLNYSRDYTCSHHEFLTQIRTNFQVDDVVIEDWQIQLLMGKYEVPVNTKAAAAKTASKTPSKKQIVTLN